MIVCTTHLQKEPMIKYRDWAPTPFDQKGVGALDRQDWYVVTGIILTRDGGDIDTHNFEQAAKMLQVAGDEHWATLSFNHWACGWYNIIVVEPNTQAQRIAEDIEEALEQHPILNEEEFIEEE